MNGQYLPYVLASIIIDYLVRVKTMKEDCMEAHGSPLLFNNLDILPLIRWLKPQAEEERSLMLGCNDSR